MDVAAPSPKATGLLFRLLAVQLEWVFLGLMLLGFALVVGSWLIGIDDVTFDPGTIGRSDIPIRQVGYVSALNWGLTYVLFFPTIAVLLVGVLQDIPRVVSELETLHVLRAETDGSVAAAIVDRWKIGTPTRTVFIGILGVGLPAIYSVGEWLQNNLLRFFERGAPTDYWDWDWGLKCVMPQYKDVCDTPHVIGNLTFDLVCFLTQFLYLALLLTFLIYIIRVVPEACLIMKSVLYS